MYLIWETYVNMDVYSSIFDVTNTIISSVILFYAFTVYVSFFYVAHFPTYVLPAPPTCIMFFKNNWGKITVWGEANGCSGEKNMLDIPWWNKAGKHLGVIWGDHNKYFKMWSF